MISDAEVRTPSHSQPHIAISPLHVRVLLCVGETGVQVHEVCVESWSWMRQFQRLAAACVNNQFPPVLPSHGGVRAGANSSNTSSGQGSRLLSHSHPHIAISALHVRVLVCVGETGVQVHEVCVESWTRQFQRLAGLDAHLLL